MKVKISEEKINKLINESIKKHLNEFFHFNIDGGDENDTYNSENDELDRIQANGDLMWLCNKYNLDYKDLSHQGNGIFAVTSPIDKSGHAVGDIKSFLEYMNNYVKMGKVKEIGGGISPGGKWYRKYQITANLK